MHSAAVAALLLLPLLLDAADGTALECAMLVLHGYRAVGVRDATAPPDCRRQRLAAVSFDDCATACLAQPFCEAATWFSAAHMTETVRQTCIGRTAGSPSHLVRDPGASAAVRTCTAPGCGGLQARLDATCEHRTRNANTPRRCRQSTVARNRRVLGTQNALLEDFDWVCTPPPLANATMLLACVDDRGEMAACTATQERRESIDPNFCVPAASGGLAPATYAAGLLHDLHRAGCGNPTCVATAGSGWPPDVAADEAAQAALVVQPATAARSSPSARPTPLLPHWVKRRAGGSRAAAGGQGPPHARRLGISTAVNAATRFANAAKVALKGAPKPPTVPALDELMREPPIERLRQAGYLNCSFAYDELKDSCAILRPDFDWLHYTWSRPREGAQSSSEEQTTPSASARAVSWWLPEGAGATAVDPFDAELFIKTLARLGAGAGAHSAAGAASSGRAERPEEVLFVGDSTARQQTVSLCCLLMAGTAAAGGSYHVRRIAILKAPWLAEWQRVDWTRLNWTGLGWTGLDWTGLGLHLDLASLGLTWLRLT